MPDAELTACAAGTDFFQLRIAAGSQVSQNRTDLAQAMDLIDGPF